MLNKIFLHSIVFFLFCGCAAKYSLNGGAGSSKIGIRSNGTQSDYTHQSFHVGLSEETSWFLTTLNYYSGDLKSDNNNGELSGWEAILALNFPYIKPRFLFGNYGLDLDDSTSREIGIKGLGVALDFEVSRKVHLYFAYDSINPSTDLSSIATGLRNTLRSHDRITFGFRYQFYDFPGLFSNAGSSRRQQRFSR